MIKILSDYKWFNEYVDKGYGIKIGNLNNARTFFPTKKRVRSCKNCQFHNYSKCDLNVPFDRFGRPVSNCFPCKSNKYFGNGDEIQGDELRTKIYIMCDIEDRNN